ncbi:hypothetical protein KC19_8G082800 [Ceratodon purpureus]|uniref:GB1/RHD3-type G domain-containing protein n=1 Tax=Ceratodon purpureus TaxID=3225 RepID=A0A8T0H4Q4_CERPU|nr:hypothetical protein KC19_8G082800 [Ceratodon purpureus]
MEERGRKSWSPRVVLLFLILLGTSTGVAAIPSLSRKSSGLPILRGRTPSQFHRAVDSQMMRNWLSIVEPDPGHTKLAVTRSCLDAIARITNPIAVVAVIGPYRSGKSFLLNQLLSLSCNEGFGVGHMRDTKTRGV